jgi:hypothetical protein
MELCVFPATLDYEPVPMGLMPNDQLSYEIVLGHQGSSVTGAVLSTTLPVEVQYDGSTPTGAYDPVAHEVVWTGLDLADGIPMTATVDVIIRGDTELCALMESSAYLFYGATEPVSDSVLHSTNCLIYLPVVYKGP